MTSQVQARERHYVCGHVQPNAAPWSLRRALVIAKRSAGSLYRHGKRTSEQQARRRKEGRNRPRHVHRKQQIALIKVGGKGAGIAPVPQKTAHSLVIRNRRNRPMWTDVSFAWHCVLHSARIAAQWS